MLVAFASFANTANPIKKCKLKKLDKKEIKANFKKETLIEIQKSKKEEEDGIYCRKEVLDNNGNYLVKSCWFCNCAKL